MTLLLGPVGVGKTLLCKRLQSLEIPQDEFQIPSTIPTVGTNLVNISVGRKKEGITIREMGGCMGPIWHKYLDDCTSIIFMIDLSNRQQISAACIQLYMLLTQKQTHEKPVLILLHKVDASGAMSMAEFMGVSRYDEVARFAKQKLTLLQSSAVNCRGLHEVMHWITACSGG